jgi:hypothetical protein
MARKKSPAQLEKEIAVALRPPLPALTVTKVHPYRVDEWVGVQANFQWKKPFDKHAFTKALNEEKVAWFNAHPGQMHVGMFPLEEYITNHISREIARSKEWAAYAKPHPPLPASHIDDWHYDERGGSASHSERDENWNEDDHDDDEDEDDRDYED